MNNTALVSIASVLCLGLIGLEIHGGDFSVLKIVGMAGVVIGIGWAWQRTLAARRHALEEP